MLERQDGVIYLTALVVLAWLAIMGAWSLVDAHAAVPIEPHQASFGENPAKTEQIVIDTSISESTLTPETVNVYQEIWQAATDEERELVAVILAMEAQGEPYEGERAVVEVILNRVVSPEWPDTIYGVLSQKGQFATWKRRNNPYNVPTLAEYQLIEDTVQAGPEILPEGYVYFATRKVNGKGFIKIQGHYFSY